MKVAITSPKIELLYNNGVRFNTVLWYDFFENCGYDVSFVTNEDVKHDRYKFLNYMELWNKDKDGKHHLKNNYKKNYPKLFDFDVVFNIGLYDQPYFDLVRKEGIKLIYVMLGSTYHNDVHSLMDERFETGKHTFCFDEVWISPHFYYCQEYYKIRYNCEKVFICPYFWRDDLFKAENVLDKILTDTNNLRVAVVEPNIEQAKNCLVPMAICEKAHKHIQKIKLFNTIKHKDYSFFKSYVLNTEACKAGKVTVEGRHPLPIILSEYCNCVVSYVEDCDLNYVFLECFYLGVPLIHNSPMLKDYGYYYPRLNVSKGAKQIENVVKYHNREEYIKKHKPLISKYSVTNPVYIAWVKGRLDGTIDFDCDVE